MGLLLRGIPSKNMLPKDRIEFLRTDFERGFIRYCKIKALDIQEGLFRSEVVITNDHRQQDGFIHAGLMATMADHTAGYAAFTLVPEEQQILTIEFKINFLKPAYGERLICRARIIRAGSQILVGESDVIDVVKGLEREVAKALVTLASVPRDSLRGKQMA